MELPPGRWRQRNYAEARRTLEEADRLRPDYALPLVMLVKLSLVSGEVDDLKKSLLVLGQRFPADGRLHAELARDLIHQKQYDLALAEALRTEQSGNFDETSIINLAVLENQIGAFDDAIRHAIAIKEQTTLPDRIRAAGAAIAGLSYESLGQLEAAVQNLRQAIQLDPGQENPYIALARIYERQHNTKPRSKSWRRDRHAFLLPPTYCCRSVQVLFQRSSFPQPSRF